MPNQTNVGFGMEAVGATTHHRPRTTHKGPQTLNVDGTEKRRMHIFSTNLDIVRLQDSRPRS